MRVKIELLANLAVIITALLISTTVIREHWFQTTISSLSHAAAQTSTPPNNKLELRGVKWDIADKTLVMALSTACHFCEASTPFYRQLTRSKVVQAKRLAVIAVFPQEQKEAETYMKANEILATTVLSTPLQDLGASATPTLFLVDRTGKVEKMWVGVLSPAQQNDLLAALAKV
ncbi:MAG TPA: hypothetical protein VFA90_00565 [Terriglobales bacterium]|nr:hypothetical protein [Terriglobales bacterium]